MYQIEFHGNTSIDSSQNPTVFHVTGFLVRKESGEKPVVQKFN